MEIKAPFDQHRSTVLPEWIDYNGHMNVAYYVLAFDHATDAFLDYIGLDQDYRSKTGGSTFAVESFVTYQREVTEGAPLRFTTQLLACDAKRLRFFHRMFHATEGYLAATSEWLILHVDLNARRVSPMPAAVQERLAAIMEQHRILEIPGEAGRAVHGLDVMR
jgi:acyl-CoA thioester hydrolase